MKDIYKNPILYYILVPLLVGLWPLLVWGMYLGRAERNWELDKADYLKGQQVIDEILELDPERLDVKEEASTTDKFDYPAAISEITRLCGIPTASYEFSSKPVRSSGGKKTQSCHLIIRQVSITQLAMFLSTSQLRWPSLQSEKITLTKTRGTPDDWKVDLDLRYYF